MKIAVCVKQIVDTEEMIRVEPDGSLDMVGQAQVIDPYGEFCVERAVQLKEERGGEVVIVSVGESSALTAVRHALAMGGDRAIVIEDAAWHEMTPALKAAQLAEAMRAEEFDVIMGGWKSGDTGNAQVMGRIAELLHWPFASMVTSLQIEDGGARVECETDDGSFEALLPFPLVVSVQQGFAEPRYPTVRDVIQARKKPIEYLAAADFGRSGEVALASRAVRPPRDGGRIVSGSTAEAVAETVRCLREEAKVL